MKKLLMLGTNNGSVEIIKTAKKMGYYTITTDYLDPKISKAKLVSDEYWNIDTSHIDELEKKCIQEKIDGVICGISAFNITMTMELCERLNLPTYCTPDLFHYTMNKYDFKELCRQNNVPIAKDYFVCNPINEDDLNSIDFPVVVKAVDQSANRGMSYCYDKKEIIPAINYAHEFSKDNRVVIERMLKGTEYTAYYALADGEAVLVNLFSDLAQPGTPGKCYSVNSTACDKLDIFLKEVDPYFKKALKNAGFKEGVCWIELIFDEDQHFYVIEMGYRMTGDMMAIAIRDTMNFDSYKWLIEIAMGIKHCKSDLPQQQAKAPTKCGCAYIMWSKNHDGKIKEIIGLDKINNFELNINADVGQYFRPEQYILTFIFTRDNANDVCKMINEINNNVFAYDENGNEILIRFTDFNTLINIYNGQ